MTSGCETEGQLRTTRCFETLRQILGRDKIH